MINESHFKEAKKRHQKSMAQMIKDLDSVNIESLNFTFRSKLDIESIRTKMRERGLNRSFGVYGIFISPKEVESVKTALHKFREGRAKENRQAVPKPNSEAAAKCGCLYIGMSMDGSLERRLLQHFHFAGKGYSTTALKFSLWKRYFNEINFRIYCFKVDKGNVKLARELESAMWNYYEPAIGKL